MVNHMVIIEVQLSEICAYPNTVLIQTLRFSELNSKSWLQKNNLVTETNCNKRSKTSIHDIAK